MSSSKKLQRSSKENMLFGVAGGLAEYINVDPVLVRLAFIICCFFGGIGFIAYIALAIIMPKEETDATGPVDVMRENMQNIPTEAAEAARQVGDAVRGSYSGKEGARRPVASSDENRGRFVIGIFLIGLGGVWLMSKLGVFDWFAWGVLWPLALIGIGVAIIVGRHNRTASEMPKE